MRIEAITTTAGFDDVADVWTRFEDSLGNANLTTRYDWLRAWWEHMGPCDAPGVGRDKKLCILLLYGEGEALRAIAPFCEVTHSLYGIKYRAIEFLSQQWGATYIDFISPGMDEAERDEIFAWLRIHRRYDLLDLRYIPQSSPCFDPARDGLTLMSACPEIYADSYDDVTAKYYGKNLRHKLTRLGRKIEREGVDLAVVHRSSEEVLAHFEDIRDVSFSKELSEKRSIYRDSHKEGAIRGLIRRFADDARCSFVTHRGKTVAYNLGFRIGEKYYAWDAAYSRHEEELRNFSLGNLNYDFLIRHVFDQGCRTLCLGTGIDPYKLKFSGDLVRLYALLQVRNNLRGRLAGALRKRLAGRVQRAFEASLEANLRKG